VGRHSSLRLSEIRLPVDPPIFISDQYDCRTPESICFSACEAIKRMDFVSSVQLFTEAIATNPRDPIPYYNRSSVFALLRDWVSCRQDAGRAIFLNDRIPRAYWNHALASVQLDDIQAAYEIISNGLSRFPEEPDLLRLSSLIFYHIERGSRNVAASDTHMSDSGYVQIGSCDRVNTAIWVDYEPALIQLWIESNRMDITEEANPFVRVRSQYTVGNAIPPPSLTF
jgi:hypothetical protein